MLTEKERWDIHWKSQDKARSLFGRICELHRKLFISRLLKKVLDRYFTSPGFYLDAGSGTSQTASRLKANGRKLVALDLSYLAIKKSRGLLHIYSSVQADIRKLPFREESIDGIWNLGVMEHFEENEILNILSEFHRVLKKNTYLIMLWPPVYGSSQIVLRPVEKIRNRILRDNLEFFPGEPTRLRSRAHAKSIISGTQFRIVKLFMSPLDMFTYMVVVCRKT